MPITPSLVPFTSSNPHLPIRAKALQDTWLPSSVLTKWKTMPQDLTLDVKIIWNTLEQSPRFQIAMQALHDIVSIAGAANMWLAGHSSGSAIALLAGKNMAKMGCLLETYLFNPPFVDVPVELTTKTKILKCGIHFTTSVMKAGVAVAQHVLRQRPQMDDWFAALSGWTPYLFVHPSDPVSTEYVGYFKHREWMVKIGAGAIERIAARNLISGAYQPLHLLPSAHLIVNVSPAQNCKQAHGLDQWWRPDIQCQSKLHKLIRYCTGTFSSDFLPGATHFGTSTVTLGNL
ncbi:hypothetical protein RHMOL_Rhmol02G0232200 [Rhododendron molle]|uniref:Uncharacterized protein n=1 Tax=Rhododendron molle TaxID=49168 RepID=A0ACC0PV24_RHOML|nr:hypothetical protein RHMOL_Rhmol02G0232200 [Rhododendron molle]